MAVIDVLVAGGGPSGLALASLLAQAGLVVRVLEPRLSPGTHSRAIGLHPPALGVLDAVGVGASAVAAGVRIRRGFGIAGGETIAAMDFGVLPGRHRYVLALPQARTVRFLEDRLDALDPGARMRGASLQSFHQDNDGVRVAYTAAPPAAGRTATAMTRQTMSARYLVAADGVNSTTRTLLGLSFAGRHYPDHYVMGDYPDTTRFGPAAALILHRAGIVESFPLPDGLRRWVAWRRPDEPADLSDLVLRRTGHLVDPAAASMLNEFRCSRRSAPRLAVGRVILIGDAAHEVSPIGGQGMALGLLDAAALAPLLIRAVRGPLGGASVPGDTPATPGGGFAAFSAERLRAAARAGRQAHLNMMLGRPLAGPPDALRRRVISGLAANTAVHDAVAHRFTMNRGFHGSYSAG